MAVFQSSQVYGSRHDEMAKTAEGVVLIADEKLIVLTTAHGI